MGAPLTGFEEFMAAGPAGPAWDHVDFIDARHSGATPSLNINGWMDVGAYETVKLFEFQQHHDDQYLIMAPTEHCKMTLTAPDAKLGDRPIGDSTFPYEEVVTSWFHRWLRDDPDAWEPMPKVAVYLMGAGIWLRGERWPLPEVTDDRLYLASDESANTLWGDGRLEAAAPAKAGADHFVADPDGTAYNLADSCLRLRYHDGMTAPSDLVPGHVYRIEVRGITTANYFPAGHRIRIELAGSNFPLADRNWNADGVNELATDGPIAHVTVHHGAEHPSCLRFHRYTGVVEPKPLAPVPA